jgi:CPSF A subunit region
MQVVLYSTITGAIGAFLPFSSKEDVDFFVHLEMHMRQVSAAPNQSNPLASHLSPLFSRLVGCALTSLFTSAALSACMRL